MKKAFLLLLLLVGLSAPLTAAEARPAFLNGASTTDGFNWSRGGGDPLQLQLRIDWYRGALALPNLNLAPELQVAIREAILNQKPERFDIRFYEGKRLQNAVMVSGSGWLAFNPMVTNTENWPVQKFGAASWFVTTTINGQIVRVQVILADACGNLIIIWRGGAVPCTCEPAQDACSQ